jgi:hypothetical protein
MMRVPLVGPIGFYLCFLAAALIARVIVLSTGIP